MKLIGLFTLLLTGLHLSAQTESPFVNTYSFGEYRVETGFCDYTSKLEVFYKDKSIAKFFNGEGGGYVLADSINLNNDGWPDFVCSHMQEDAYSYAVFLVSKDDGYKFIDPDINNSDPSTYGVVNADDYQYLIDFAVLDVDKNDRPDIVFNVLEKDGQIIPLPQPGTDTVGYEMLQWHISEFDTNSYWLPEKYVEAVVADDTANASDYLFPIAKFFDPFGKCLVVTYKAADPFPQLMQRTTINGITKYRLEDLHHKIRLDAVPPSSGYVYVTMNKTGRFPMELYAERLKYSVVTIMKRGEKLLMEITDAAGTEQIYFIDRYKGKKLTPGNFPVRYFNYRR